MKSLVFLLLFPAFSTCEIGNLFDTLEEKPTPLYSCTGWMDGIKYRVPSKLSCDLVDTAKPSMVVNITMWWQQITSDTIPGYECYGIKTTNVKKWFFFGANYENTVNKKINISPEECWRMIKDKISPKGSRLERVRDGHFGTQLSTEAEWDWNDESVSAVDN